MSVRTGLVIGLIVSMAAAGMAEDERQPLREAHSSNERFRLRIHPGRARADEGKRARAALFERRDESRLENERWKTRLVNEAAPRRAFIRDDGAYVVTVGEFRRSGQIH